MNTRGLGHVMVVPRARVAKQCSNTKTQTNTHPNQLTGRQLPSICKCGREDLADPALGKPSPGHRRRDRAIQRGSQQRRCSLGRCMVSAL